MPLNFQNKQSIVAEIKEMAKNALSVVTADLSGVTVNEVNKLRQLSREASIYVRVVRNTLLCRALEGTSFEVLKSTFVGPTLIAYSMQHPGSAARLFKEFMKTNTQFKIKAAVFEGKLIPAFQIENLATLPTYEEAILKFITTIQKASVRKLIYILIALQNLKKDM